MRSQKKNNFEIEDDSMYPNISSPEEFLKIIHDFKDLPTTSNKDPKIKQKDPWFTSPKPDTSFSKNLTTSQ